MLRRREKGTEWPCAGCDWRMLRRSEDCRRTAAKAGDRPPSGLTSRGIDAIKGVAILAVVVGHNTLLSDHDPGLWRVIYTFNIFPFFFLPFLLPARPLTRQFAADRTVRYLVPWALVYLATSLLFFLRFHNSTWLQWLADVALGLVVGTGLLVKQASGFTLFWFLPCLFALVMFKAAGTRWPRVGGALVMGSGLVLLAVAGLLPEAALAYVPATAHLALMMCPVGAALAWIWRRSQGRLPRWVIATVCGGVWLGLSAWIYVSPVSADYGSLTMLEPMSFAVRVGAMMSSFLFLCAAADWLGRLSLLVALGRHSLMVYLTSSLWFQVWLRLERGLWLPAWYSASLAFRVVASVLFSLAAAYLVSRVVSDVEPLRRWVLPRFWSEWPPAVAVSHGFHRHGAGGERARGPL